MSLVNSIFLVYHFSIHMILGAIRDYFWKYTVEEHAQCDHVRAAFSLWISVPMGCILLYFTSRLKSTDIEKPFMRLFLVECTTPPLALGLLLSNMVAIYTDTDYDIYIIAGGAFFALLGYAIVKGIDFVIFHGAFFMLFVGGIIMFASHLPEAHMAFIQGVMLTTSLTCQLVVHIALQAKVQFPRGLRHIKLICALLSLCIILIGTAIFLECNEKPWKQSHLFITDAAFGYLSVYMTYFLLRKVDPRATAIMECLKKLVLSVWSDEHLMTILSWEGFGLVALSLICYLIFEAMTFQRRQEIVPATEVLPEEQM